MKFLTCSHAAYLNKLRLLKPYAHLRVAWRTYNIKSVIMRIQLTAFIIGLAFLNVAASVRGQEVTLRAKDASIKSVFAEIKKQTGYLFWYEDNLLDKAGKITVDIKKASLNEAMDMCLKNQPLEYTINDKTIVVKFRERGFLDRFIDAFRSININGKVQDENGQALVGANVKVKGTSKETKTNQSGEFFLENVDEKAIIEISYLGFVTKELSASPTLNITLVLSTENLQAVEVNAGYYKVKERERTGSISRVDSKSIGQQPVANPLAALIGRMAGVNIEQRSGLNGGGYKVEIRGQNSLRNTSADNGNNPLYLVNGVPFPSVSLASPNLAISGISGISSPLNSIDPNDIESIEVLKDADATAIYGSRGANGVVLITTKKAKAGKAVYEFGLQQGFSTISSRIDYLDTEQYLAMRSEAFANDGVTPGATQYDVNGTWDKNRYTDWQQEFLGGTAQNTNINGNIRGGNEFTQFGVSGNYARSTTVLPVDFGNTRAAGALNVTHLSENKKFNASFAVNYSLDVNKLPRLDLTQYIRLAPNAPALYESSGNLNWALNNSGVATWVNPLSAARQPYVSRSGNLLTSAQLGYEIIPGLTLRANLGYTTIRFNENLLQPISSMAPSAANTGTNLTGFTSVDTWNIEPQVNYKRNLGNGVVDILVGSTFQSNSQNTETISASGYTSDLLLENILSAPTKIALNTASLYKYAALFGRINYNYKSTYILNLTGRRDGSSRFGPDRQFANFGAAGVAWIFSNEEFIKKNLSVVSYGKLRGSFGITGNDQIPDYGYLETYSATNPYVDGIGLFPSQLANRDFSWEINKKFEVAVDLGFLNDRLMFSTSYYRNRSSNQLVGYRLPDITGFSTIQFNLPATVQNTGWEFELNSTNFRESKLSWNTSLNLTIPSNKLLSYPGIEGSTYANTYTVGSSLYQQRKYTYLGVDPATGIYKYDDANGNGLLDAGDRRPTAKAYTSHWYGGINNSFSYRGISLEFFVQFVSKTVATPYSSTSLPGTMNNQPSAVLDRWQKAGDISDFAKYSQNFIAGGSGASYNQLFNSDRYLDASFARLKNLSLSYSLPQQFISKVKLRGLRVFVLGQNLWTITNYPGDPEIANASVMPTLRTVTAGMNVSL